MIQLLYFLVISRLFLEGSKDVVFLAGHNMRAISMSCLNLFISLYAHVC